MARSNRQLTQFAVGKLEEFLSLGPSGFMPTEAGNTSVTLQRDIDLDILGFWLFGKPILELVFRGQQFIEVTVYDGGFYDSLGRPSRTTRERLNGLLDAMGEENLIPEGVRAHLDPEKSGACFVGRLGVSQPLGKRYEPVTIAANPIDLEFLQ